MRFSPTKLLHCLLCTTPILLLTLAACGGGGDSTPTVPLAAAYTVGGAASGVGAIGLVLRNNGGDDLTVAPGASSYTFGTSVLAATSYNVTVLTNPVNLKCSVANANGTMPAYNVTNANVSCVTAYKIGGLSITGLAGTGLVLQNNGTDNLLINPADTTFTFSTPIVSGAQYDVKVLTQPRTPAQTCVIGNGINTVGGSNVTDVTINCTTNPAPLAADQYVYAANLGSTGTNGVAPFTSANGVLSAGAMKSAGNGPSSIAVADGKYAYVTNYNSNTISAYSIASGVLTALPDVDGGTFGDQSSIATASHPLAIAIHPSGKFAYVANFSSNSISAYSVDATTGKLSSIDANDATTAIDTIPTRSGPVSIAIHPGGGYAYVANATSGDISVYSIDATSGALTAIDANGANAGTNTYISTMGNLPYSVAVDPTGQFLYAVNSNSGGVAHFDIASDGTLTYISCSLSCNANSNAMTGINPRSVAVDPTGQFLYVANNSDKTVWVYNINANGVLNHAGALTESPTTGHPIALSIDTTGQFLYVASSDTAGTIEPFSINTLSGKLTSAGPAVSSGTNTNSVTTSR